MLGDDVTLVSRPSPVTLVSGPRGSIEIGDSVVLEAGCTILAQGRIVIGAGAWLGPSCMVTDTDAGATTPTPAAITIGRGAILDEGALVLHGAVVADGARIPRGGTVGASVASGAFSPILAPSARDAQAAQAHLDRLRTVVATVVRAVERARDDDELKRVEGWDSLAAINVLVAVEGAFGIVLPSNALASLRSLRALNDAVMAMAEEQTP